MNQNVQLTIYRPDMTWATARTMNPLEDVTLTLRGHGLCHGLDHEVESQASCIARNLWTCSGTSSTQGSAAKAGQVAAAAPASRPRQGPVLPAPLLAPLSSQLPPPPSQQRPSLQARPQLLLGPPVQLQLDAPLRVSPWLWAWMLPEQHACCRWGALALPRWPQKCVEGLLGQTAPTSRATIYSVLGRAIDSYCTIECLCCQARCPSGEQ